MPQTRRPRTGPALTAIRDQYGMSEREYRVACAYLIEPNLTKAAYAAGYRGSYLSDRASLILRRPRVAEFVKAYRARLAKQYDVTAERIIRELALLAFSNMADYTRLVDDQYIIDMTETTRDQMAAVMELTSEVYMDGKGDNAEAVKRTKIKLHPKRDPLIDLGKTLGLFKEDKLPPGTSFEFTLNLGTVNGGKDETQVHVQATVKESNASPIIEGKAVPVETVSGREEENGGFDFTRTEEDDS